MNNAKKNNVPNFFIVGAPKCGTTALCEYLKAHPNIFMARKETHFFATDLLGRGIDNLDDYLELFKDSKSKHYAIGEASVWYLYSKIAIENIYKFDNNAKIIAMLRNPIDLVYSKHSQLVHNCEEDEEDFEKAWYLQKERENGHKLPKYVVNPAFLQYAQAGKLGEQVERLFTVFPREQVKLILFDDFRSSTRSIYENVLSFLGVPPDGRTNFSIINKNKKHRFNWFGTLLRKPPRILHKTIKALENRFGLEQFWFIDTLHKLNTKTETRKPLDVGFRNEMLKEFNDDIDKLSHILNRDLSNWKN